MLNWMQWLPENVSSYGEDIDGVFTLIYGLTLGWFVLMMGAFLYFVIRYRRRTGVPAVHVQGNRLREFSWVLVPVAIVLLLDIWVDFRGASVWAKVKTQIPETEIQIQVTAKQFNWEILYPGPDGEFGTTDDRQAENDLHVPVGRPVRVVLKSSDVIHSFFIPNMRLKQDIIPGRTIVAWFEAIRPGKYPLVCAELCGYGHSGMKGWVHVHSTEEYEAWEKKQWESP